MSEVTVREAGRRDGTTTRERHGPAFYKEIGRQGETTTAATHGKELYRKIGKIGSTKGGARIRELIAKRRAVDKNRVHRCRRSG